MTGIELTVLERDEHFTKHDKTVESDLLYNNAGQLLHGAQMLMIKDIHPTIQKAPQGWNVRWWADLASKPYNKRLIIAASLIVAEYDLRVAQEVLSMEGGLCGF